MHKQFIVTSNTNKLCSFIKRSNTQIKKNERAQKNFEKVLFSTNTSKNIFLF